MKLSLREQAELETMVKKANQRLRQIEQSDFTRTSHAYKNVKGWALKKKPFMTTTKNGEMKFRTDILKMAKGDVATFREFKRSLETFMTEKTSTVSGTKKIYKKAYETYLAKNPNQPKANYEAFTQAWSMVNSRIRMYYGSERLADWFNEAGSVGLPMEEIEMILKQMEDTKMSEYKAEKVFKERIGKFRNVNQLSKLQRENPNRIPHTNI